MGASRERLWRQLLLEWQLEKQLGRCSICLSDLSAKFAILDRLDGSGNYVQDNIRALHFNCESRIRRRRIANGKAYGTLLSLPSFELPFAQSNK